jgi:uncharacterized protein (DUF58 family)
MFAARETRFLLKCSDPTGVVGIIRRIMCAATLLGDHQNRSFIDPAAVARLAAVPLFARRSMVGSVSGMHTSPHRGASVEFAEYRRYVPGDDIRRLDWRAYGRTDRYYVKEFEADTNLRLCLVIDTSGSMGFGSIGIDKLEYARRLAGTLAQLAIGQGDAVGVCCVAEDVFQTIPPRRTPSHLRAIFDSLQHARPRGKTFLVDRLHEFAETTPQRALVIILSDLFVEPDPLREAFDHLRFRKHDLAAFQLLDPQEIAFDFRRPTRFVDLEGDQTLLTDPSEIADRYQAALVDQLDKLNAIALESAVDYHRVQIDEDYEGVLFRFLTGRNRGRGIR